MARRLERTEAEANAAFVEARARLEPQADATWIEVAGAYAMFDGAASPLTQTFGLGLFEPVDDEVFERLESFFAERGSVSPIRCSSGSYAAATPDSAFRGGASGVAVRRPSRSFRADPAPSGWAPSNRHAPARA